MASLVPIQPATNRPPPPLLSNNPFRNPHCPPSPALPSPALPTSASSARPVSTNPFFDFPDTTSANATSPMAQVTARPSISDTTRELVENLGLDEAPRRRPPPPPPNQMNGVGQRPENRPPRSRGGPPPGEDGRSRLDRRPRGPTGDLNIFADPAERSRELRPPARRNSETSIRERSSKIPDPADEKRRRERRHRESKHSGKPKAPNRRMDIIDKLDVTSIYGTGLFHHDGPFDACNPHRNRKGSKTAPMQAFPKDSRNMQIGGSGPINSNIDLAQFHGMGEEGYNDYAKSGARDGPSEGVRRPGTGRGTSFHPHAREPLHGEESMGLGTSTFLEGAPASKTAMQRRESDNTESMTPVATGGLGRTKSIAMRLRGYSNARPRPGRISPQDDNAPKIGGLSTPIQMTQSARETSTNPFFNDYDEQKGAQVETSAIQSNKPAPPSSPKKSLGLERKTTSESMDDREPAKQGKGVGGLLGRVKSLKGGSRKSRAEKREAS